MGSSGTSATPNLTEAAADVRSLLASAAEALAGGRREEAVSAYRRVLARDPHNPVAILNLGALILERGFGDGTDLDDAIEVCRAAIALLPDPASAQALLGGLLLGAGRVDEAIEAYAAALAHGPNATALAGLARALLRTGDAASAVKAADAAIDVDRDHADAWFARGSALLALQQPARAAQAFERGVGLAPRDSRMHLGLGDAYAEVDRDQEAIAHLSLAASLDPGAKWAHANLGSMLYRAGDLEGAERHCRRALELDPELANAHQNLSGVLADTGRPEEARRHRDAAFTLSNLRIEQSPEPRERVLVLTTAGSGNIPHRFLLPKDRYTRIDWFIEYARPGQEAELPAYDVVFNIIGDPDYSDATDAAVEAFVARSPRPVLNPPANIPRTRRDRLPGLLGGIDDVLVPKCARLEAAEAAASSLPDWLAARGLSTPVLIRPTGSHGGEGLVLARTGEDLEGVDVGGGAYATEFVDYRSADGFYRKYRVIFVDRAPYPYHLAIKDGWLVHYYTSGMAGEDGRKAEELRFLEDPVTALGERAWTALGAIGRRLDLDFAGIDFSLLPDGRVLVFEANATMLVHPEPEGEFAVKNTYIHPIVAAFQALVERKAGLART